MIKRKDAEKSEFLNKFRKDFGLFATIKSAGSIYFHDVDIEAKRKLHGKNFNFHTATIKPHFVIDKNGKIEKLMTSVNNKTTGKIIFKLGELKTVTEFEEAFEKLYNYKMRTEVRKWKQRIKRNGNYGEIPNIILEKISKKLATVQKIGIFED